MKSFRGIDIIGFALVAAMVLSGVWALSVASTVHTLKAHAASFPDPRTNNPVIASSTAYTLVFGNTPTRIVATTTGAGTRVGLSVQPTNCATGGVVFMQFNDQLAATSTGLAAYASTTETFSDSIPMVSGSIRAMAGYGSCTLLVTEWRTAI